MSGGVYLSSLTCDGEEIVWQGRISRPKALAMLAAAAAFVGWVWWFALGEVAAAPGGSACITDDCPKADRKAGMVLLIAPPTVLILVLAMPLIALTRNAYAVTTRRVISRLDAPWRRTPKIEQVQIKGASARMDGFTLTVFGRKPGERVVLMAKSRSELRRALAVIEKLSQEPQPATGAAP